MTLNKYIAMYCDQITTGATLMYLAGVDLYDIMKVTGHASPKMLKKYIKADSLEVVEKLTSTSTSANNKHFEIPYTICEKHFEIPSKLTLPMPPVVPGTCNSSRKPIPLLINTKQHEKASMLYSTRVRT